MGASLGCEGQRGSDRALNSLRNADLDVDEPIIFDDNGEIVRVGVREGSDQGGVPQEASVTLTQLCLSNQLSDACVCLCKCR